MLRKHADVTDLTEVKEAFVPVAKFKFDNVEIDLLFAQVQIKKVTDSLNLLDNGILRGCDAEDIKSLNGCRVTHKIFKTVEDVSTNRNFNGLTNVQR